jgi:CHAT domain-containing protein
MVRSRSRLALGIAALVAGLVLAFVFARHEPTLRERLLAAGRHRFTPGRLASEEKYRPWQARDERSGIDDDVLRVLAGTDVARLAPLDQAVVHLATGDLTRAITGFELAARDRSTAVEALTDLSAAYLVRYESERDCLDLLRSIHAAEGGLTLAGNSAALRFNRASGLSLLGTRILAQRAWREVGDAKAGDGWSAEAAVHRRQEIRKTADEEWAAALPRLRSMQSPAELEVLTIRFPFNARAFVEEELLPRWAAESSSGGVDRASRSFEAATVIAATLRRLHGEELPADAVDAARRVMTYGSPAERKALLRGLHDYAAGMAEYNNQNVQSAEPLLTNCIQDLKTAGNPLRYWAQFYFTVGDSYKNADHALVTLDALLAEIPRERYPALTGRIEWIAGTIDKIQGRIQSSVFRTERAEAALRRSGGPAAAAFVSVLLAEAYTAIGEHGMAWKTRRTAFDQVPVIDPPRRRIAMWTEAKEALLRQGNLALAGPFVDEAVENAEIWKKPLGRATAYIDRAGYRATIGERDAAFADLRRAQAAISEMEPSSMREQMVSLALLAEGTCYRQTDPARAAQLLETALARQAATANRFHAVHYATTLAVAQIAAGRSADGEASLERALSLFENIRATVEDPVSRMQAFRQAQPAFDRLIGLHGSESPEEQENAFALAERSRSRVLLELRTGNEQPEFVHLADVARTLPRNVTLVSYVVLDDRVVVWVIEDGRARQVILRSGRTTIENAITQFRLELKLGTDATAIRTAGAPLYDMLIRPLSLARNDSRSLILIPDRSLARLPFPALFDRQSNQYLIEQRAVSVAPSATLLLLRNPATNGQDAGSDAVLAVGVSSSGEYRGVDLPALPHAEIEARRVAQLYPKAQYLSGTNATGENFDRLSLSSTVIHFAGHAVVDLEDPRRSVLLFSGGTGGGLDAWPLAKLLGRGFAHTRLVVLSACRAQDSLADDRDGLFGLAGAFVAGGAREVVASPLDVDDEAAARLMIAFHRHYREKRSAPTAFRDAVLDLRRSGDPIASSPAVWGGFTVIKASL